MVKKKLPNPNPPPIQIQTSRELAISPSTNKNNARFNKVSLSLSGGWFRASLFHLGVIGYLRSAGLLGLVDEISSVSGGSILAGHLVANWHDYSAKDTSRFETKSKEFADWISVTNLSGRVLRRHGLHNISALQTLDSEKLVDAYSGLLSPNGAVPTWEDLARKQGSIPKLFILATLLSNGEAGAFSTEGFKPIQAPIMPSRKKESDKHISLLLAERAQQEIKQQSIARAMAASSAFPPLFKPLSLTSQGVHYHLTDGGVFDNSGVRWLQNYHMQNANTSQEKRLVIASDAGRLFPFDVSGEYDNMLNLAMRVSDTQAYRISASDFENAKEFYSGVEGSDFAVVAIHERWESECDHSWAVQDLVGQLRTELDEFKKTEILSLYRHGYLVADKTISHLLNEQKSSAPPNLRTVNYCPVKDNYSSKEIMKQIADGKVSKNATGFKTRIVYGIGVILAFLSFFFLLLGVGLTLLVQWSMGI